MEAKYESKDERSDGPVPLRAGPEGRFAGGLGTGLELAALWLRVVGAVGRSAPLAERHADRTRRNGLQSVTGIELGRAKRARQGARRGRALAARYAQARLAHE